MAKIKTPVRYGTKLQALNELGVLTLHSEVKQTIQMPVGDERPVDSSGTAAGRFLACNKTSGLTVSREKGFENYEYIQLGFDQDASLRTVTFSQVIRYAIFKVFLISGVAAFKWVSLDDAVAFMDISEVNYSGSPLHTNTMRFGVTEPSTFSLLLFLFGFY